MSKRVMIAGTGSGSGKTTLTCALLAALMAEGKKVVSFKCGPDYIDPMFHQKTTGAEARNLDIFLMGEEGVKHSVKEQAANKDIAVLEGVMGLYDGRGSTGFASANHVSLLTNTPVVLILNAKGAALSVCALLKGFLEFEKNNIRGVILNNVPEKMFGFYKQMIEERFAVKVIGFLPHLPAVHLESRHLGLVTADEVADILAKINLLREWAVKCIDLDALAGIAAQARPFHSDFLTAAKNSCPPVKICVARDAAFSFFYEDNHDLLRTLGAEIKFFSPLKDQELPPDADGLILWGGYPELYAQTLAENENMKQSLSRAIRGGLPVYAECGGFMYLQETLTGLDGKKQNMLGVLPGNAKMTERLQNFGYYEIEAQQDNLLCEAGGKINAHFFHHSVSDDEGNSFLAVKKNGRSFPCIVAAKNIFAGYQHLHFWGNPEFARRFLQTCFEYRRGLK